MSVNIINGDVYSILKKIQIFNVKIVRVEPSLTETDVISSVLYKCYPGCCGEYGLKGVNGGNAKTNMSTLLYSKWARALETRYERVEGFKHYSSERNQHH